MSYPKCVLVCLCWSHALNALFSKGSLLLEVSALLSVVRLISSLYMCVWVEDSSVSPFSKHYVSNASEQWGKTVLDIVLWWHDCAGWLSTYLLVYLSLFGCLLHLVTRAAVKPPKQPYRGYERRASALQQNMKHSYMCICVQEYPNDYI